MSSSNQQPPSGGNDPSDSQGNGSNTNNPSDFSYPSPESTPTLTSTAWAMAQNIGLFQDAWYNYDGTPWTNPNDQSFTSSAPIYAPLYPHEPQHQENNAPYACPASAGYLPTTNSQFSVQPNTISGSLGAPGVERVEPRQTLSMNQSLYTDNSNTRQSIGNFNISYTDQNLMQQPQYQGNPLGQLDQIIESAAPYQYLDQVEGIQTSIPCIPQPQYSAPDIYASIPSTYASAPSTYAPPVETAPFLPPALLTTDASPSHGYHSQSPHGNHDFISSVLTTSWTAAHSGESDARRGSSKAQGKKRSRDDGDLQNENSPPTRRRRRERAPRNPTATHGLGLGLCPDPNAPDSTTEQAPPPTAQPPPALRPKRGAEWLAEAEEEVQDDDFDEYIQPVRRLARLTPKLQQTNAPSRGRYSSRAGPLTRSTNTAAPAPQATSQEDIFFSDNSLTSLSSDDQSFVFPGLSGQPSVLKAKPGAAKKVEKRKKSPKPPKNPKRAGRHNFNKGTNARYPEVASGAYIGQVPGTKRAMCLVGGCGRTYADMNGAKRHQVVHFGHDRTCPACGKGGFLRSDKLQTHWRVKHPDRSRVECGPTLLGLYRFKDVPTGLLHWILDKSYNHTEREGQEVRPRRKNMSKADVEALRDTERLREIQLRRDLKERCMAEGVDMIFEDDLDREEADIRAKLDKKARRAAAAQAASGASAEMQNVQDAQLLQPQLHLTGAVPTHQQAPFAPPSTYTPTLEAPQHASQPPYGGAHSQPTGVFSQEQLQEMDRDEGFIYAEIFGEHEGYPYDEREGYQYDDGLAEFLPSYEPLPANLPSSVMPAELLGGGECGIFGNLDTLGRPDQPDEIPRPAESPDSIQYTLEDDTTATMSTEELQRFVASTEQAGYLALMNETGGLLPPGQDDGSSAGQASTPSTQQNQSVANTTATAGPTYGDVPAAVFSQAQQLEPPTIDPSLLQADLPEHAVSEVGEGGGEEQSVEERLYDEMMRAKVNGEW